VYDNNKSVYRDGFYGMRRKETYLKALPVTTVKSVSRSGGDLTGLLVVTTPLVRGDSAPLVRCCFHRTTDATPIARAGGTVKRSCIVLIMMAIVSGGTSIGCI
jgi:hypothetical protein